MLHLCLKMFFTPSKWILVVHEYEYQPRISREERENVVESERTREGLPCFRDSEAKGRLRKRRMRDRAKRASQATEDREARLQQRRYRLAAETAEERERGQGTAEKRQAGSRDCRQKGGQAAVCEGQAGS